MANRIQFRRDTTERWRTINPILQEGELGIDTDTGKMKIGDGFSSWTELPYLKVDSDGFVIYKNV